jgi:hypothetical protein
LEDFWTQATAKPLYKSWLGGLPQGLLIEGGLYNSAPLKTFLNSQFSSTSLKRSLNVGIVDLLSGLYVNYNEEMLADTKDLESVMYASFSPVVFTAPAAVLGSSFVDGAAVWDIDIFSAINNCEALGFKEENIVVDVLLTIDKKVEVEDTESYNSLQMLYRYLTISRYYGAMDGLTRAQFAYPKVNFRNVVGPSTPLHKNRNPLDMD